MNVGFFACGMLSFIFILLAIIFAILKSKASVLISGFNSKSKEERSLYDEEKMCRDQRNAFLIWDLSACVKKMPPFLNQIDS